MVANGKSITRTYIGSELHEVCELPNLIGVQLDSYERFLQLDRCLKGMAPDSSYGLEEVFQSTFPIDSPNGEMRLAYKGIQSTMTTSSSPKWSARRRVDPIAYPSKSRSASSSPMER